MYDINTLRLMLLDNNSLIALDTFVKRLFIVCNKVTFQKEECNTCFTVNRSLEKLVLCRGFFFRYMGGHIKMPELFTLQMSGVFVKPLMLHLIVTVDLK